MDGVSNIWILRSGTRHNDCFEQQKVLLCLEEEETAAHDFCFHRNDTRFTLIAANLLARLEKAVNEQTRNKMKYKS